MSAVVEVIGQFTDNISGGLAGLANAFHTVVDAIQPFVDSASDSEIALSRLDTVLASTAPNAGVFTETIGQLSNEALLGLIQNLDGANDELGEMEDEYRRLRNPTEEQTLALEVQRAKVQSLTAQIEAGREGWVVYRDTTQLTRDALIDLANAMQTTTVFSDEMVLSAEEMLLRFENVNATIFPDAIRLAGDLATVMGTDLTAAAQVIGRALDDPAAGIGRLNMQFRLFDETEMANIRTMAEHGDLMGAQQLIIQGLTEKIGGAAEAFGETFAGKIEIARNKLDNLRELIGGPFLSVLSDLLDNYLNNETLENSPFIQFFERLNELLGQDAPFFQALGLTILDFREFSPLIEDIGLALLMFDTALQRGLSPLEAFQYTLSRLVDPNLFPALSELLNNFSFQELGEAFIDWTLSIDWEGMSNRLADGISSIDWGRLGNIIAEGLGYLAMGISVILEQIDWSNVFNALANAFADLIGGLFGFVDWEDMISSAEVGFRYVGAQIVEELREGLLSAWDNFTGLPAMLFNNFITSVKTTLGIFSPSTVFANIGRDIVLGLIGGFTAYWDDLVRIATSSLDNFLNMFGIDLSFGGASASGLGTAGTGTAPGTGGTTTGGTVINNFYGPVTFGDMGQLGYDCPSPHPLVASSGNQLVTTGF